jgi:protein SCO1/2
MFSRSSLLALLALGTTLANCSTLPQAPDFALQDDGGARWQLSQQHGKSVLLTFGYTHCADTCPALVARLERITASLHARSQLVEIAVITVDPARDSPAVMHRFLQRFSLRDGAKLVGLTGTPAEIARVEAGYHVWSKRLPAHADAYDVAHSAVVYVIDPRGEISAIRDDDDSQRTLLSSLGASLR